MTKETPGKPEPDHVLTWRQRKILQVIRDGVQRRGYPPSMIEIAEAVGLKSMASVSYQVTKLEQKGYLSRDGRRPRTVELRLPGHPPVRSGQVRDENTDQSHAGFDIPSQLPVYVPLAARIAADGAIVEKEGMRDVFPLPRALVGDGKLFILTMTGDSMIHAAIADLDWVVVRRDAYIQDGDIIAVLAGGAAMVRRFRHIDGRDWLIPHHGDFTPVLADDATILGRVVAVVRQL